MYRKLEKKRSKSLPFHTSAHLPRPGPYRNSGSGPFAEAPPHSGLEVEAPLEAWGLHALMSYMRFPRQGKQDQGQVLYNWIFKRTTGTLAHFFSSSQINYALCSFRIGFFLYWHISFLPFFPPFFFSPLTGFKCFLLLEVIYHTFGLVVH